ncbi:NADP-dependent oxidoreductase [Chitinophaga silvisoli]|uniref:NADP-dependent oxidoreductase n=1 Tax=Chitinophaga silvisoli TaxID=2291814 RepID=A0A3E1P044_9BACT|nr:NADP-dependent oxidoreductase [Chitinophaga silvisoli]RFM33571.1 NADP-dependent oxidoreductase [Chitinophaga silvisoli]
MEAYILEQNGGVENLKKTTIGTPVPKAGEVLIKTRAIGINPIDVQVRASKDMLGMITGGHLPDRVIPGWDVAGTIEQTGDGVTAFNTGDEVYGLLNMPGLGSTYSNYVIANIDQIALKPENLDFTAAGATPMAALTAWQAVVTLANIRKGEKVLIHAASGGVGHFAVQFAKVRGAYVIGTASAKNEAFVRSLGVDEFLDYTAGSFEEKVNDLDVVIDTINSVEHIIRSISVIKRGGKLIYLQPHFADALSSKLEETGIKGFGVFVNSSAPILNEISTLIKAGKVTPQITKVFSFDQLPEAQTMMESGRAVGKIAVEIQ